MRHPVLGVTSIVNAVSARIYGTGIYLSYWDERDIGIFGMGDDGRGSGQADGSSGVSYRQTGAIAELVLDAPPRNLLGPALRAALIEGLDRALADPQILGVVLHGAARDFSYGIDLDEAGRQGAPTMSALCSQIEAAPKCVVALIGGAAFGAGLELALAAHYRLAVSGARFATPGIAVGLLPDAGATQRLPRLVGVTDALRLLISGAGIETARARELDLIDEILPGGGAQALDRARTFAARMPPRPTMQAEIPGRATANMRALALARGAALREGRAEGGPASRPPAHAVARLIDCIEAGFLLPPAQALTFETATAAELAALPETEAQKYAYRASRRAAMLPPPLAAAMLPATSQSAATQPAAASPVPSLPEALAIWGAGAGARALVGQALARRMSVTLIDPRPPLLAATIGHLAEAWDVAEQAGHLTPAERDARRARLTVLARPEDLPQGALVLASEDAPPLPDDILTLPLGGLGPLSEGVALFPAQAVDGLAELALGGDYPVALARSALDLARRLGWRVAITGPGGPVVRRLRKTLAAAVAAETRAGHDPAEVALALAGWGLGSGMNLPPVSAQATQIVTHCLLALANEGARMIDEGVVPGAMTVDALAVGAGLVPRHQGGPMYQADRRGVMVVRAGLEALAEAEPGLYAPSALILRLLHDGQGFSDLG